MTERESLVELRGGAIEIHGWDFAFSATLDEKGRLGYFGASIEDDDVPTANLLAMLDADGCPEKRTAAWAIREIVQPDEIVAVLPPGTAWCRPHVMCYQGNGAGAERRAIARAHPWAALAMLGLRPMADTLPPGTPTEKLVALLDEACGTGVGRPPVDASTIRMLDGIDWTFQRPLSIQALLSLPRDWYPREDADRKFFERLVEQCEPLSNVDTGHGFLRGFRGRWADIPASGWYTALGGNPSAACHDALDPLWAYLNQVHVPSLALARPDMTSRLRSISEQRTWRIMSEPYRLLYGAKSLPAILEFSARWHARHHAIDNVIWSLGLSEVPQWPIPFTETVAPNGVSIRFLRNDAELRAEGSPAALDGTEGLAHCVGSYGHRVGNGQSCIASLRDADGRRLSTLEIHVDGHMVSVQQHRGHANALPPPEAVTAEWWFRAEITEGRLKPEPEYLSASWDISPDEDPIRKFARYEVGIPRNVEAVHAAWAPLLPRPLRPPNSIAALPGTDAYLAGIPVPPADVREGILDRTRSLLAKGIETCRFLADMPFYLTETLICYVVISRRNADVANSGNASRSNDGLTANRFCTSVASDWPQVRPLLRQAVSSFGLAILTWLAGLTVTLALQALAWAYLPTAAALTLALVVATGLVAQYRAKPLIDLNDIVDIRCVIHMRAKVADLRRRMPSPGTEDTANHVGTQALAPG